MTNKRTRPPVSASASTATGQWLRHARITPGPACDVIIDMCQDPDIPALFSNKAEMRNYLETNGACREAMTQLTALWLRYRRWVDQHPFCQNNPMKMRFGRSREGSVF